MFNLLKEKTKFLITFTDEQLDLLYELKIMSKSKNIAKTIQFALAASYAVCKTINEGNQIKIIYKDGTEKNLTID